VCKILCVNNSGQNCETVSIGYFSLFFWVFTYVMRKHWLTPVCMQKVYLRLLAKVEIVAH
jgi:hypothetical protein